ncbi:MAG: hypothetical protein HDT28_04770 [Clostridiales bacterium]|nr:hypothetical protein [Clostridiales bacterium]
MSENISIKSDGIGVARGQAVVEARSSYDGACRILSVSATAALSPSEVFAQEARYQGKVTFDCLALIGERVECISAVAEFSDKITSPVIAAGSLISLTPDIINVEASAEGGIIKAVAVVDVTATVVASNEVACLAAPDEGVYANYREVEYCTLAAESNEVVYVSDRASAKYADILYTTARAAVSGVEAADGEIKVSGNVYFTTIVREDDGMLASVRTVSPFVKSVPLLGVNADNTATASVTVGECGGVPAAEDGAIELAATLNLCVRAFACRKVDAINDVFCADNEIEVKNVDIKTYSIDPPVTVVDTVDGQVTLPADRLAADTVLCVTGTFCTLTSVTVDDKRVNAEGLVGGDIVYYNAETNGVDSLAFRLPFSIPIAVHTAAQDVTAVAVVTDVNVRVRRESVFDIKADVAFTLNMGGAGECVLVQSVACGAPIERPDASVIIHIAKKGETLWQAAKALGCAPDKVAAQNDADAPYAGGERLINFCKR